MERSMAAFAPPERVGAPNEPMAISSAALNRMPKPIRWVRSGPLLPEISTSASSEAARIGGRRSLGSDAPRGHDRARLCFA